MMNRTYRHSFPLPSLFPDATKIGQDRFRALCPVHAETHPSCIVNYHRKHGWRWHCFACGGDGDALDVLTERDKIAVREALAILDVQGLGERAVEAARVRSTRPTSSIDVICDACRSESRTVEPRDYGRGLRAWTSSAELESATLVGWELSAGLEFAIGPKCLESRC